MSKKNKQLVPYYNVLATSDSQEATIFLYGYIGPEYEFDYETYELEQVGITDIGFVTELNRLAEQYPVINIRINSPGGEVFHGSAIVSAIMNCASEVHTYNDGVCASMAAAIFLAGKKRYMAKNAMLMLHPAMCMVWGNAQDCRDMANVLDKMSAALVSGIAAGTGKAEADIQSTYFSDYKDHWITYAEALADGLITPEAAEAAAYVAEGVPTNLATMTYGQLVAHFTEKKDAHTSTLLESLRAVFSAFSAGVGNKSKHTSPVNSPEMNLEDFKQSLADGTLNLDEVKAHLAAMQPAPATAVEESAPVDALKTELETMRAQMQTMQETIANFGKQPGAGKSAPPVPDSDTPDPGGPVNDAKAALDALNQRMAINAQEGASPFRPGR